MRNEFGRSTPTHGRFRCLLAALGALLLGCQPAAAESTVELFEAAAAGDPSALFRVADMYESGRELEQDFVGAATYMRLSAERGFAPAQYRLGLYLAVGLGVEKAAGNAYWWLSLAARSGSASSMLAESIREAVRAELSDEEAAQIGRRLTTFAPSSGPVELAILDRPGLPQQDRERLLRQALERRVTGLCGTVLLEKDVLGRLQANAYVRSSRRSIATADEAAQGAVRIALVPLADSLCDIIDWMTDLAGEPSADTLLGLRTRRGAPAKALAEGDLLMAAVRPHELPRYVTIDYFVRDGVVLHMFPNAQTTSSLVSGGRELVVGDPDRGMSWAVSPPFGNDLMVVIASRTPLFDEARQSIEDAGEYQRSLDKRFRSSRNGPSLLLGWNFRVVRVVP